MIIILEDIAAVLARGDLHERDEQEAGRCCRGPPDEQGRGEHRGQPEHQTTPGDARIGDDQDDVDDEHHGQHEEQGDASPGRQGGEPTRVRAHVGRRVPVPQSPLALRHPPIMPGRVLASLADSEQAAQLPHDRSRRSHLPGEHEEFREHRFS